MSQVCDKGHPLVPSEAVQSATYGKWFCNDCRCPAEAAELCYRCKACRYDKCIGCIAAAKHLKCPNAHALVRFVTDKESFACNMCKAKMTKGAGMASCRGCNYDLCVKCVWTSSGTSFNQTAEHGPKSERKVRSRGCCC